MATLTQASRQWATRPADQRFSSLDALHAACSKNREISRTSSGYLSDLRFEAADGGLTVVGKQRKSDLTHWAFGQICTDLQAPAGYLRRQPATLAAQNLNHDLANLECRKPSKLLFHAEGDNLELQAVTSQIYGRYWNNEITAQLLQLVGDYPEWQPAPAAFDGSRGLYASDSDMFAFLVDNNRRIFEKDPAGGLSRGFFVSNSEVGKLKFNLCTFLYSYVCGNHMVWGAENVAEIGIRHTKGAIGAMSGALRLTLKKYAESSGTEDELRIESARKFELGKNKNEVLDFLFKRHIPGLTKSNIEAGYERAHNSEHAGSFAYASPRSAWGFAQGLTEVARDLPHADQRVVLERAAGKVVEIAF